MDFKLRSNYQPRGDQPAAIDQLVRGLDAGDKHQVLLGVTGSGKTFTMAKVIEAIQSPRSRPGPQQNTRRAALSRVQESFFPENAVEYFVSYYDYYQPEAYVPSADLYIDKEATINDELDKLRMSATRSLFERRDVVIVSSVSCIYGLGSPGSLLRHVRLARKRPENSRASHCFTGSSIFSTSAPKISAAAPSAFAATSSKSTQPYEDNAYRLEMWGNQIDAIRQIDPVTGEVRTGQEDLTRVSHLPENALRHARRTTRARHSKPSTPNSIGGKRNWRRQGKFVEAQRVTQRTMFDIEMMRTVGYCHGVENYSRHLSGRLPGEAPPTLLDYFPAGLFCSSSTNRTRPSRRPTACTTATARASKPSSTTASACPRPSTIARSPSRSSSIA